MPRQPAVTPAPLSFPIRKHGGAGAAPGAVQAAPLRGLHLAPGGAAAGGCNCRSHRLSSTSVRESEPPGAPVGSLGSLYIVSGATGRQARSLPLPAGYRRWGEIPRDGELRKPVLPSAEPICGRCCSSSAAEAPSQPHEFAWRRRPAAAAGWFCGAPGVLWDFMGLFQVVRWGSGHPMGRRHHAHPNGALPRGCMGTTHRAHRSGCPGT